jgi:hypothetical protein
MARPRQTATTETPARAPRKPVDRSKGNRPVSGPQKARNRRESASKATGPAKAPNKFDAVAMASAKGDDDLARKLAASISERPKTDRPTDTKDKGKPKDNGKTDPKPKVTGTAGNGRNGAVVFKGRPTSNRDTIAARAKEAGLRVRKDADPADIATRLRATVEATAAWLEARNGSAKATDKPKSKAPAKQQPAKVQPKQQPAKHASEWVTGITLQHAWAERTPDYLKGRTLVIRYQVKSDGTVWATLTQLREADGSLVPNFKDYPLDYRPTQERDGRNRPVILKGDLEGPALQEWLLKQRLASPRDIETSS